MRVSRNHFKDRLQFVGQSAIRLNLGDVVVELCLRWQVSVQQQERNFFEARVVGEVINVITAVSQACTFLAYGT